MNRIPYALAAGRIFDTPLLMHETKALLIADILNGRQRKKAGWYDDDDDTETVVTSADIEVSAAGDSAPYRVVENVAIIPVDGSLAHKTGNLHASSGITGYDGITAKLRLARQDPEVKGIWMDFSSYGGEVSGCFDLADEIRAERGSAGGKPIWACINEDAYSAAYALASQADVIVGPRTSAVGSIGVVMMHADYSGMLAEDGIKVTMIHAGKHKVDGNPYEALKDETYQEWLASCESVRQLFAGTVALGRGVSTEAMLATEARCYAAADAVQMGMMDVIASPTRGLAAFVQELDRR